MFVYLNFFKDLFFFSAFAFSESVCKVMRFIWNFQIFREKFFKFFFGAILALLQTSKIRYLESTEKGLSEPSSFYQHVIALARFPLESGCKSRRFLRICKTLCKLFSNKFCNLHINHWLSNMLYSRIFLLHFKKATEWYILNIRVRVRPPFFQVKKTVCSQFIIQMKKLYYIKEKHSAHKW